MKRKSLYAEGGEALSEKRDRLLLGGGRKALRELLMQTSINRGKMKDWCNS